MPATERLAPVQGYAAGIPWAMHLRAYDAYCKLYGKQQALIEGSCRGGFGVEELDSFIPGWREELSEIHRLRAEVDELRAELRGQSHAASLLRDVVRQTEPDRELLERYGRELDEIGKAMGCDHKSDGYLRCVTEQLDKAAAAWAAGAEKMRAACVAECRRWQKDMHEIGEKSARECAEYLAEVLTALPVLTQETSDASDRR
jgi:cell division septum initiation protein DivIVA